MNTKVNPRVAKLRAEREKNAAKIEKLTARNKKIDETVLRLENTDIIGMVREMCLTPEQLAVLLEHVKADPASALQGNIPGVLPEENDANAGAEEASPLDGAEAASLDDAPMDAENDEDEEDLDEEYDDDDEEETPEEENW